MFSDVLRKLRKEKGLSQSALADILNMSQDSESACRLFQCFNLGNDKTNSETNAISCPAGTRTKTSMYRRFFLNKKSYRTTAKFKSSPITFLGDIFMKTYSIYIYSSIFLHFLNRMKMNNCS